MKAFITFIFLLSATVDANEDEVVDVIAELREKLDLIYKEANQTKVSKVYIFDMQNFKSKILIIGI